MDKDQRRRSTANLGRGSGATNIVRPHWTTGEVPAVRLGIMATPLRLEEIHPDDAKGCMMSKQQQVNPSIPFSSYPERPLTVV